MYLFMFSLILLLIFALIIIAIPFIKNKHSLKSKPFLFISSFVIITSIILYFSFCQPKNMLEWLAYGKEHYELATKVQKLGGITGLIGLVKKHLEAHPDDKKASEILRKLTSISQVK